MTRAIILIVGALGLAFVWRAAGLYQATDPLAYRLVLLIGVGLIAGVIELSFRATRVAALGRALVGLPASPAKEDIDKAPPQFRALVEARLHGTPQGLGNAVFTSYLLGLLVMLGLLGTFMGLFETLSGAREALTTSGDVTALRAGLAAPMKGLSRAFGTSATGVACSAMLGLAAVFLRRAESRFSAKLAALTAGPLFPLTIAGRQLAALEAIASDRKALPAATRAIEVASKRLVTLASEIERGQRESSKEATDAIRNAASSIQKQVEAGVMAAADAVGPLLDRAVLAAGEGASNALGGAAQAVADQRDATVALLTEHAVRVTALDEGANERARDRAAADEQTSRRLADLGERLERIAADIDSRTEMVIRSLSAQLEQGVDKASSAIAPMLERTAERAAETFTGFLGAEERRIGERDRADARRGMELDELIARMDALTESLELRSREQAERAIGLETRLERERVAAGTLLAEKLADHAAGWGQGLDTTAGLVRGAAESVRASGGELTAVAEMFSGAVDRYREANERWLDNLSVIEGVIEKQGEGASVDLLAGYLEQTREMFDHSMAFQRELFAELRALRPSRLPSRPTAPPRQADSDKGLP